MDLEGGLLIGCVSLLELLIKGEHVIYQGYHAVMVRRNRHVWKGK